MPQKVNFTKRALDAFPPSPITRRSYLYDEKVQGLALAVTPAGTKTFVVYRWVQGRPERIRLGRYPDLTIEQARGLANAVNADIAQGKNPNDRRRWDRAELTLEDCFQEYLERHAKRYKRSWQRDDGQFQRYLRPWRKRKLSHIRKRDIQLLHASVGQDHGPYAANRLLALLRHLFNKSRDWGFLEHANPAIGITRFREASRERFLQADEFPRFFQALADEPNQTVRDYFLLSLLTGARRANVQAMEWTHINFAQATWTIPTTKSGATHTVPLVPEAIRILKAREAHVTGQWVFPGTGQSEHLMDPKRAWKRILKRAGLEDLRLHDLRRTLGSWQASTGASLPIIGKALGHTNVNTTAIYSRLSLDPVRQAVETATEAMFEAGKIRSPTPVLTFTKKTTRAKSPRAPYALKEKI